MKRKGSQNVVRILLLSVIRVQHVQMRTSHRLLISLASPPQPPTTTTIILIISSNSNIASGRNNTTRISTSIHILHTEYMCKTFCVITVLIILDLVGIQGYIFGALVCMMLNFSVLIHISTFIFVDERQHFAF